MNRKPLHGLNHSIYDVEGMAAFKEQLSPEEQFVTNISTGRDTRQVISELSARFDGLRTVPIAVDVWGRIDKNAVAIVGISKSRVVATT